MQPHEGKLLQPTMSPLLVDVAGYLLLAMESVEGKLEVK
jgi:hypothetical protein